MVNVDVIGRLGADAEVLNGKRGDFVSFRLATDDYVNNEKATTWFRVAFNGERALKLAQYLKKGTPIFVRGTETVGTYTDRNGAVQVSREINAVDVEFIRVGTSGQTQTENSSEATPEPSTGKLIEPKAKKAVNVDPPMATESVSENTEDDLPF
jgi:single-strand DNA-binding protein